MVAIAHDDAVVWYWAPAVAGTAPNYAPTVANIAAATRIPLITNYDTPSSEAEIDVSDTDSNYDTGIVGTTKAGPITLTMKRDSGAESNTWALFDTPREAGFLIKTLDGPAVATSKCEVYPVQVGQRRPEGYGRNTAQKFAVAFYVTSEPKLDAVVVP